MKNDKNGEDVMEKEAESLKQKIINNGTIQTFTSIERNGIANFL